jgi:hypothetical protein
MTRAKEEFVIMDSEFKRRRFLNNEPVYRVEQCYRRDTQ